ncbi:MAG: hypothetical protein WCY27_00730 [archaeon]|jgi:isoleucyl-tRNA synthetase|nr:hypothetical protein [archaeon]MDD2477394.1 hypothetical protein [Candidatus ainarchaeum sp.]MDD3084493.1 hypothetical protein [Candidatus ainarchaeum sp.]MDD4220774.1 hypothetical protein [Candidatus ainarchaeum sp.]MDD4662273.1 hypothetical protein [Candidatus ainarchaeum sp.]
MDNNKLSRRERRHYRKYKDGEIVYTSQPDITSKKKDNYNSIDNSEITLENLDFKKDKKTKVVNNEEKAIIINKILTNLSEMIKPDVNVIAEAIYTQLKNKNIDVEKNKIESAIKTNRHYRASENRSKENLNINENKEDLRNLVEDVYSQVESNDIRDQMKKDKVSKEKNLELEEEIKSKEDKESKKDSKKGSKRDRQKEEIKKDSENKKVKQKEESKTRKKEDDIKDLLKDEELDDFEIDNSDDGLGLKF